MKRKKKTRGRWNVLGRLDLGRRLSTARRWISSRPLWARLAIGAGAVAAAVAGGAWAYRSRAYDKAVTDAKALIGQGFTELAAERLAPWRSTLVHAADGCELLMTAHFRSRQANELASVAEACIQAGQRTPATYVGLAVSRELKGMDELALQILDGAVQMFPSSPDIPYRRALIYRRLDRKEEAAGAYVQTASLAPSNGDVHLEALRYLLSIDKGAEAGQIAQKLRAATINDLSVKLLVARGLYAGGDRDGALAVAREIRDKAQNDPSLRTQLRNSFPELGESQEEAAPVHAADQTAPGRGLASPAPPAMPGAQAPVMPQMMADGTQAPATPPMTGAPAMPPGGAAPAARDPAMMQPGMAPPAGAMQPGMAPPAGAMPPPAAGP